MSFNDAIGRIGTIQATLAQVSGTAHPQPAVQSAAGTGASGSAAQLAASALAGTTADGAATAPGLFSEALNAAVKQSAPAGPAPVKDASSAVSGAQRTGGVAAPGADNGTTDGGDVVAAARKYLGVPYVWGGNNPAIGLDCSSLVQHTFRDLGVKMPRVARDQAKMGTEVPSLSQAKPGDLIVTRGGGHIGIYLGDNRMLHAPRPGEKVSIRELFETDKTIMTIRRIVPAEQAAAAAPTVSSQASSLAYQRAAFAGAAS
jgi:cell wall-associated NlpC family hydrolase